MTSTNYAYSNYFNLVTCIDFPLLTSSSPLPSPGHPGSHTFYCVQLLNDLPIYMYICHICVYEYQFIHLTMFAHCKHLGCKSRRDPGYFFNRSAVSIAALLAIGFSVRYVPRVTRSVADRKPLPSEDDKMGRNCRALKESSMPCIPICYTIKIPTYSKLAKDGQRGLKFCSPSMIFI